MKQLIDKSIVSKKNVYVIGFAIIVFLLLTAGSIYKWIAFHNFQPTEIFFEFLIAIFLYERGWSKYTVQMQAKQLVIHKVGLFGELNFEIPYKSIVGIYRYKPKLMGAVKFCRTWRMHSALDGREVLTIAYQLPGKKGIMDNYRIYTKLSNQMLDALREKIPNKIMISEKQAAIDMILGEDKPQTDITPSNKNTNPK